VLYSSGNYGDGVDADNHDDVGHSQDDQIIQRQIDHDGDTLLVKGLIPFSTTEDELAKFFDVCIVSLSSSIWLQLRPPISEDNVDRVVK